MLQKVKSCNKPNVGKIKCCKVKCCKKSNVAKNINVAKKLNVAKSQMVQKSQKNIRKNYILAKKVLVQKSKILQNYIFCHCDSPHPPKKKKNYLKVDYPLLYSTYIFCHPARPPGGVRPPPPKNEKLYFLSPSEGGGCERPPPTENNEKLFKSRVSSTIKYNWNIVHFQIIFRFFRWGGRLHPLPRFKPLWRMHVSIAYENKSWQAGALFNMKRGVQVPVGRPRTNNFAGGKISQALDSLFF
jgi:hypothetical protein